MIKNVVVIGAGAMGAGISQIALMGGYDVTLVIKEKYIDNCTEKIRFGLEKLESKKKLKKTTPAELLSNLSRSTNLAESVKKADLVLEAVTENLEIKKKVFKIAGENAPEHCILVSNTSSMSIKALGEASGRPEKVCGAHFFIPAPLMRLVEIVRTDKSSDATIEIVKKWAEKLPCVRGKRYVPIALKDRPGFIANRLQAPAIIALDWALDYAVENGIPLEHVDNDLFTPFMPMSPLILLDYIGLDVNYDISKHYESVLHPDFKPGEVMSKKIKMNELGKKTGKGLYEWKGNTLPEVDRTHKAGILSLELVFALQANEGCRLLEEKVIDKYSTVDDTLRNGFNMLGPFSILMDGNEEKWVQLLEDFAKKTGKVYLKPCELMKSGGYKEFQ